MRILYIGNKLSQHGFTPTTVETLGKQLSEFCEVISVSDKQNKFLRMLDMVWAVFKYRKYSDYVIIDTYSTSNFYFALAAALCCRILHKKYIPILHGGNLPARLDNSPRLSKAIFKYSYRNVTPSGYLNYEFCKRGFDKLITIPNNILVCEYSFTERKMFYPKLLWVRAFDKTYNCEMAVDVLSLLLKEYPEAKLCMVGPDKDGSMERVKQRASELSVVDSLLITGKLGKKQWKELSREYDIFINTTNFDNTPVSVVEAMALGLAVVTTNVGGIPHLLSDGKDALLIEKGDSTTMAQAIKRIIKEPDFATRMCIKAREKVETFDWSIVKEQWKETLK